MLALGRNQDRYDSGAAVLLNTSYTIHQEPIVRTPAEAIETFLKAKLDCLAMGPILVMRPEIQRKAHDD